MNAQSIKLHQRFPVYVSPFKNRAIHKPALRLALLQVELLPATMDFILLLLPSVFFFFLFKCMGFFDDVMAITVYLNIVAIAF